MNGLVLTALRKRFITWYPYTQVMITKDDFDFLRDSKQINAEDINEAANIANKAIHRVMRK